MDSPRLGARIRAAQLDLGYLYEQGKGVPIDHVAAYMWYKTAADRGEHRAAAALKSLSSLMTDAQIKQATAAIAKLKISTFIGSEDNRSDSLGSGLIPPR
jgi:TPR repeat protein